MYNHNQVAKELWAVLNESKEIVYSRGGSSSNPKLMVYPTKAKALAALNNYWSKQVHSHNSLTVEKVY
jgi:hypothetical protein